MPTQNLARRGRQVNAVLRVALISHAKYLSLTY